MSTVTTPPSADVRHARLHRPRRGAPGSRKRWLDAYLLISPSSIGVLLFLLVPLIGIFAVSLLDWNLLGQPRFIGIDNYVELAGDEEAWLALGRALLFALIVVPGIVIFALLAALLVNTSLRGIKAIRVLLLLPWIATPVAVGTIYSWIYDANNGFLNTLLGAVGLPQPNWLNSPEWALPAVAFVTIWQWAGYNMLFYLAGLQGIPDELIQAAKVDGAGPVRTFWSVTLPLLRPTTFFIVVTATIGSFQAFDLIAVLTGGGPGTATNTILYYIYNMGFRIFRSGYAATLSVLLFVAILVITLILAVVLRRSNERIY
jgi:multiple sugar transport system permease protein/sn-glycerol 3-phosphate transport system permease protein